MGAKRRRPPVSLPNRKAAYADLIRKPRPRAEVYRTFYETVNKRGVEIMKQTLDR